MDPVRILYFIDPTTGTYRGSCPSANGRLLDTWAAQLGSFRAQWEAPSRMAQRSRLQGAVDALRERGCVDSRYALGGGQPDGERAVYEAVGYRDPGLVLLRRVGAAVPGDGSTWTARPRPAGSPEFWWANPADVMWVSPNDVREVTA